MRMEIDKTILGALEAAVEKHGSQLCFARISGVKHQNLSRYLSRQVTSINNSTWRQLFPHLVEFLPRDYLDETLNRANPPSNQVDATCKNLSDLLQAEGKDLPAEERRDLEDRRDFLAAWADRTRRQEFELRSVLNGYFARMSEPEMRRVLEAVFAQSDLRELQRFREKIYQLIDQSGGKKDVSTT